MRLWRPGRWSGILRNIVVIHDDHTLGFHTRAVSGRVPERNIPEELDRLTPEPQVPVNRDISCATRW